MVPEEEPEKLEAAMVPGAMKVEGMLKVTAPVEAEAVISLVVPAREVTPVLVMVTVRVAPAAVAIPVPPAMVRVWPLVTAEGPVSPAAVNRVVPVVRIFAVVTPLTWVAEREPPEMVAVLKAAGEVKWVSPCPEADM